MRTRVWFSGMYDNQGPVVRNVGEPGSGLSGMYENQGLVVRNV